MPLMILTIMYVTIGYTPFITAGFILNIREYYVQSWRVSGLSAKSYSVVAYE